MANNRTRETQEKRRREHEKQTRQLAKEADRRERNAKKKSDKLAGIVPTTVCQTAWEMIGDDLDVPSPTKETP